VAFATTGHGSSSLDKVQSMSNHLCFEAVYQEIIAASSGKTSTSCSSPNNKFHFQQDSAKLLHVSAYCCHLKGITAHERWMKIAKERNYFHPVWAKLRGTD